MTRQERLLNLIVLLIPLCLIWLGRKTLGPIYLTNPTFPSDGWDLLVHKGFNTTFWWITASSRIFTEWGIPEFACSLGVLAIVCLTALTSMRGEDSPDRLSLLSISVLPAALLVLHFGYDGVVFTLVAQITFTVLVCLLLRSGIAEHIYRGALLAFFCIIFHLICESQLSSYLLLALAATLFVSTTDNRHNRLQPLLYIALLSSVAALCLTMTNEMRRPPVPEFGYPANARVVPDDGVAGNILPLLGETTIIPFINRPDLKHTFEIPALLLFAFSLLTLSRRHFPRREISWIAVFLAGCVALDAVPADSISTLAPLETLRRIVPGTAPLALLPAFYAVSLSILWVLTARSKLRLVLLVLSLIGAGTAPGALNKLPNPFADQFSSKNPVLGIVASPSLDLLRHEGIEIIELLKQRTSLRAVSVAELDGTITTSHHKKLKTRKLLSDARTDTRWSPRRGAQYGDEWVQVELPAPVEMLGLQALPGKYFSDFPRGLRIDDCQSKSPESTIKTIPDWQGGLTLSPSGFPYYTGQHDVNILFPEPVTSNCLKISQTAENMNFDWSIAELRLLTR